MKGTLDCNRRFGRLFVGRVQGMICAGLAALAYQSSAEPLTTWFTRTSPTGVTLEGVTFGAGVFVAVGEDGTIISSPDGVTWTPEVNPSGSTSTLEDVLYANGIFVAVGRGSQLVTSPDGHTWTKQTYDQGSGPVNLIHDGTRFVLLKAGASLSVSTNGINWTQAGAVGADYDAAGIAFGNNTYVEVGYKRTGQPPDVYSAPAFDAEWVKRDGKADENFMGVGFAKGLFIAVGQEGTLVTSPNGIDWTPRDSKTSGFIWNVTTGGPYIVASSQWGRLQVSENGTDWTRMETEISGHLKDVTFGKQTFVAVGWDGAIVQSNPIGSADAEEIRMLKPVWKNDGFSCEFAGTVGSHYVIEGSADGKTWAERGSVVCNQTPTTITDEFASGAHSLYRLVKR
jgi:photosystem II stability/assembly factor-like uncharacterized protein